MKIAPWIAFIFTFLLGLWVLYDWNGNKVMLDFYASDYYGGINGPKYMYYQNLIRQDQLLGLLACAGALATVGLFFSAYQNKKKA